jgi:maltokinase
VPDPVHTAGPDDVARWRERACSSLDEAVRVTGGEPGERLRARAPAAVAAFDALAVVDSTPVTRVHGDLHVGQVLRWAGGYAVSDFDGNPVLPAAERAAPAPPARDVAGMLRSLDHVGRIVDRRTSFAHRGTVAGWTVDVREAFLAAYRATTAAAGRADLLDERLLHPFEVEQECRELVYAARHLPRWTYVPDAALADLLPVGGPG